MLYEHFKKLLQKRLLDFGEDALQRKVKLIKVRKLNDTCDGELHKVLDIKMNNAILSSVYRK